MPLDAPISAPPPARRDSRLRGVVFLAAWAGLVVGGFSVLVAYEGTPGSVGKSPAAADPGEAKAPGYTLVMAAHPRCPCTRASMSELATLMTRLRGRLTATVWFYTPADAAADWPRSNLWKSAAALPGVSAKADPDGQMATRLGAETSGQVLLFDSAGRTVFSGGITGARGHEGDNDGVRMIEALVLGQMTERAATPVFGCAIREEPPTGAPVAANEAAATDASKR